MKNTDILYPLSTDYERLYTLLHNDKKIIGFIAYSTNNEIDLDGYSKLTEMTYSKKYASYDLGMIFFECDFNKDKFIKLCEKYLVRFIDVAD